MKIYGEDDELIDAVVVTRSGNKVIRGSFDPQPGRRIEVRPGPPGRQRPFPRGHRGRGG